MKNTNKNLITEMELLTSKPISNLMLKNDLKAQEFKTNSTDNATSFSMHLENENREIKYFICGTTVVSNNEKSTVYQITDGKVKKPIAYIDDTVQINDGLFVREVSEVNTIVSQKNVLDLYFIKKQNGVLKEKIGVDHDSSIYALYKMGKISLVMLANLVMTEARNILNADVEDNIVIKKI